VSIFLTEADLDQEPVGDRGGDAGEEVRPLPPSGPPRPESPGTEALVTDPLPPDPPPERRRPVRTYVVKKGDTLSEIAARVLGSVRFVEDLLKANPGLRDRNHLRVGQVLILPAEVSRGTGSAADRQVREQPRPVVKTRRVGVKRGDTLYGFAEQYLGDGTKWPQLLALNRDRIGPDAKLVPGTTLLIPVTAGRR
jgi:nucleoid-associated protein YgaU